MRAPLIINKLATNLHVFQHLFATISKEEILWRPYPKHWCLLEILCHLHDNEHEDFKARVQSILENPNTAFIPIEPALWVIERGYVNQNFDEKLTAFLQKRNDSIEWLNSLVQPSWENTYLHETYGQLTARNLLVNWLAHDNLHIRQITRIKYLYLQVHSGEDLSYAGNW